MRSEILWKVVFIREFCVLHFSAQRQVSIFLIYEHVLYSCMHVSIYTGKCYIFILYLPISNRSTVLFWRLKWALLIFINPSGCDCCTWLRRLDVSTMYKVRQWERFQYFIKYEHQQVSLSWHCSDSSEQISQKNIWDRKGCVCPASQWYTPIFCSLTCTSSNSKCVKREVLF
jgi:hypothetical protein